MSEQQGIEIDAGPMHIGRSWTGHRLEDDCPCEKAPCGLVVSGHPTCPEHSFRAAKTIRQGHLARRCPHPTPPESSAR